MNTQDQLSNYRCDHLFLLVGTNPLPNYVAARLLAKPGGYLYMLASSDTIEIAKRLTECLGELGMDRSKMRVIELSDPSDPVLLLCKIKSHLATLQQMDQAEQSPPKRIGLNYTGGTKPMAVHTHETLLEWCSSRENLHTYIYSYLDPRRLAFRFAEGRPVPISLTACQLSLEQLVALHGWEVDKSKKEPILPQVAQRIAHLLGGEHKTDTLKAWRQWCDWHLRTFKKMKWEQDWSAFQQGGRGKLLVEWINDDKTSDKTRLAALEELIAWVQTTQLKSTKKDLVGTPAHPAFSEEVRTLEEFALQVKAEAGWKSQKWPEKLAKFLDGEWLESYVLDCIEAIAASCEIHDARMDIEIKKEVIDKKVTFQFDVAAMRGYQLFALSCTTDTDKDLNKKKLFEAFTRARQMGGDEARVALVGGYPDASTLLNEIQEEWQAPRSMIRVFGPPTWPTLTEHLEEWFTWQTVQSE